MKPEVIDIKYDGNELSAGSINEKGGSDTSFHILPDKTVEVSVFQGETIIGSGAYLIHEGKIFVRHFNSGLDLQMSYVAQPH